MRDDIERQMENFDSTQGDRIDPVATVCRMLYLRTLLCPCRHGAGFPTGCRQCQNERAAIEAAWGAPNPPPTQCPSQDSPPSTDSISKEKP